MAATETRHAAPALPGPPELLPGRPDAIVDLQTDEGAALVGGAVALRRRARSRRSTSSSSARRRTRSARARSRTAPTTSLPHAEAADFDDSGWARARARGHDAPARERPRVLQLVPDRRSRSPSGSATLDPTGATVVFEVVVDDYAEVWVNGELPHALGDTGGPVVGGFNAPNRVVLTRDARPGERSRSPSSASTARSRPRRATTSGCARRRSTSTRRARAPEPLESRDLDGSSRTRLERVAGGFEFTEGPVWSRRRRAAVQLAEHERDLPLDPESAGHACSARRAATPASTSAATTSPARTG